MNIESVYKKSQTIGEKNKFKNKYTWAGFHRILDVRLFSLNDTFAKETKLNDFVRRNGSILIFPNKVQGKYTDFLVRSTDNNKMLREKLVDLPYGVKYLRENFKYGDPLFVVEGIGDWVGVKLLDKTIDVVAMQTNGISNNMYEIYASITNNIILIPDNDERGRENIKRAKYRFSELGVTVGVIDQYGDLKDTGEILERAMLCEKTNSTALKRELNLISKYYKAKINQFR